MSTERTPIVTDERVEKTIKALYPINGLTKGPDTRMQLIRRVAAERMACELRDIYEAALASKDAEIEALLEAAKDVVSRWDSPKWKYDEHTGAIINRLRVAAKLDQP